MKLNDPTLQSAAEGLFTVLLAPDATAGQVLAEALTADDLEQVLLYLRDHFRQGALLIHAPCHLFEPDNLTSGPRSNACQPRLHPPHCRFCCEPYPCGTAH